MKKLIPYFEGINFFARDINMMCINVRSTCIISKNAYLSYVVVLDKFMRQIDNFGNLAAHVLLIKVEIHVD